MWLSNFIIVNYKSCKHIALALSKDDPNILIGINDCGKSTALKAIGLLLQTKPIFNFQSEDKKKSDVSNQRISVPDFNAITLSLGVPDLPYDENQCIVIGKFEIEDEDIVDDRLESYTPHLQWIIANLSDRTIWLAKIFCEKSGTISNFILTKDVLEDSVPIKLYTDTAANLKERAKRLNLSKSDINNGNNSGRYKNVEYVEAIYNKYTLAEVWVDYSLREDRGIFPEFSYLDWNVSMEQLQQVAKAALTTKITSFTDLAYRFAKRQSDKAQLVVDVELENFTRQFASDLPNVKAFKSNIVFALESKITDILINKNNTHGDIHLDSQGEGVKRQIWFALIKWTALNSLDVALNGKKFIWCFDEPETHLYPKAQRDFFQIIKQVSAKNVQCVISTHSTVFIDRAKFTNINKFELNNGFTEFSNCSSTNDVFEALQIRNSDFLFYDKFLVVEGDTEEILIPHLFKLKYNESLTSKGVQIINLGGKDKRKQNHHLLNELFKDFNKEQDSIIHIFDNDINFDTRPAELSNLTYFCVGKQDIEDSIDKSIWMAMVNENCKELKLSVTEEDIEHILQTIPADKAINSNQKFYPKLKWFLKQKLHKDDYYKIDEVLPDKGKNSGLMIAKYFNKISDIDPILSKAFSALID